ncbi:MAG: hypothetical protein AB7N76_10635 [Planctomycetota bacterium]
MSMRPRFRLEVPMSPEELHQRLDSRLACDGCPCRAVVLGNHVEVMIRDELSHFWSPRLSLEILPHPNGAVLNGLFGPNPNVWTMFLAGYAFLILSAIFSGILGLVQLGLNMPAWGLGVATACVLGCALPYAGSQIGQRLAAEQMELLRCFLEESLGLEHERAAGELCPPPTITGRALPLADAPST